MPSNLLPFLLLLLLISMKATTFAANVNNDNGNASNDIDKNVVHIEEKNANGTAVIDTNASDVRVEKKANGTLVEQIDNNPADEASDEQQHQHDREHGEVEANDNGGNDDANKNRKAGNKSAKGKKQLNKNSSTTSTEEEEEEEDNHRNEHREESSEEAEDQPGAGQKSCIFNNGVIIENGVARNATRKELHKLKKYLRKVDKQQKRVRNDHELFMRSMNNFAVQQQQQMEKMMAAPASSRIDTSASSSMEMLSMPKQMKIQPPPKVPCLCKGNCNSLVILSVGKL